MRYGWIMVLGAVLPAAAWAEGDATPPPAVLTLDRQQVAAGRAITPDLRARISVDRIAALAPIVGDGGLVQKRATGAMLDYYPDGSGQGFHLSAGTRYFARANYARDAQRRTNGVLYAPDVRVIGLRAGYKRYAPVAMLGYTHALGERLVMGVEGGAMTESVFNEGPRVPGVSRGGSAMNPMAHLVMGFKF